jgi:hypothetical protein
MKVVIFLVYRGVDCISTRASEERNSSIFRVENQLRKKPAC